jgi:hypothetical protein
MPDLRQVARLVKEIFVFGLRRVFSTKPTGGLPLIGLLEVPTWRDKVGVLLTISSEEEFPGRGCYWVSRPDGA